MSILKRGKYIIVLINKRPVKFQFDTTSDITLISRSTWELLGKPTLKDTTHVACSASGNKIQLTGELIFDVSFKEKRNSDVCFITDSSNLNLLGLDFIEKLDLFKVPLNSIFNTCQVNSAADTDKHFMSILKAKFNNVFQEGLGCCTKVKATLKLKSDSKSIFRSKRPVQYAALSTVENEQNRLQQAGVIQPINYSSWAATIVMVKKANGKVRLCADFSTGLNDALDVHQYPLPEPEDLFTKLNGGTCFAKLDLADAYLQMEVDEDSNNLLTKNTHRGLFQFCRLPFGIKSAPAIFQQTMDTMLSGLPGVFAYINDIIITGTTLEELLHHLTSVLDRIQQYGFRLRLEKCKFFQTSVKYLGFIYDKNGRRPDPENIHVIKQLTAPTDLSTLCSFLGLVSHYGSFLPELHKLRGPLNNLLQKDTKWNWSNSCKESFEKIKSLLSSDQLLTHYDPSIDITVVSDASDYGVGAVISLIFPDGSEKAIAHSSKSLTPTEHKYSQIEKEALVITFAVKKFHKMLYGRHFTQITDHKPLISIFGSKKGILVYTANRLQR